MYAIPSMTSTPWWRSESMMDCSEYAFEEIAFEEIAMHAKCTRGVVGVVVGVG